MEIHKIHYPNNIEVKDQDGLLIWRAKYIPHEQFYEKLNFLGNCNESKNLFK